MKKRLSLALCLPLPLILSAGCGSSDPIVDWADDPVSLAQDDAQEGLSTDEAQEAAALRQQKSKVLVDNHLELAQGLYGDGRLLEAENHLVEAMTLDPTRRDVRSLLEEIQVALGRANTSITGSSDDVILATRARVERLQAETTSHFETGMNQLNAGEIDSAIGSLHLAQANIRSAPFQIDWMGLDARVDSALEEARSMRATTLAAQRNAEEEKTYARLRAEAQAEQVRISARRNMMFQDAVSAFSANDYDQAISLADELLREDPLDSRSLELRDTARRARHQRVSEDFLTERTERFRTWVEDNEEARIPFTDLLRDPDPEHWARISDLRQRFRRALASDADSPENLPLMEAIASMKVPGLQFEGETSIETVVEQLRTYTDIPFVVTPNAIEAVDAEGIEFNLNLANELTVENALNIIVDAAGPEVAYTFRNGVVYITSAQDAMGELVLKAHDVQDLTQQIQDFAGPKIKDIRLPDDDTLIDDEEPIFGGVVGDEPRQIINPDNLESLITTTIDPLSWDEMEGVSIRYQNGFLTVRHTPEVQNQIRAFLDGLRRYNSSMITIETRFITITKDYLREIGVDWRGLGGGAGANDLVNLDDLTSGLEDNTSAALDNDGDGLPDGAESNPSAGAYLNEGSDGDIRMRTENMLSEYPGRLSNFGGLTMQFAFLDDVQSSLLLRAVEKSTHAEEVQSTTVAAQNTQRSYMTMVNQVTYVQDFDVEVAQAALIADPVIGVISDGIVLDVRPVISQNRDYISLEIRPTIATLLRPIPEFTSSLAGLTTPVTLQLPELQIASAETTALVPDGGSIVIGGLKKLMNMEQRSEVPFLGDIPILSMLFKAEGEVNENQDTIILLKATITDSNELANRLSN